MNSFTIGEDSISMEVVPPGPRQCPTWKTVLMLVAPLVRGLTRKYPLSLREQRMIDVEWA